MVNIKFIGVAVFAFIPLLCLFPQFNDIKHLPTQNQNQSITESTPVVISENEIIIFYVSEKKDTIYFARTDDGGLSWNGPKFVIHADLYNPFNSYNKPTYLSSLKTTTGRILLTWADWDEGGMWMIYSDDNAVSWSDPFLIRGGGNVPPLWRRTVYNINLSGLKDGRIYLSFNNESGSVAYYRESLDNGITWSEIAHIFPTTSVYDRFKHLNFVSTSEQNVLAVFEYENGIYKRESTDGGETWLYILPVIDSPLSESRPGIVKDQDNRLWLIYQVEDTISGSEDYNDIYYSISVNNGGTWSEPQRFTRYIGKDYFVNAALLNAKPFITFSSRRFTNRDQISCAVLGETIEDYKPPYIFYARALADSVKKKEWLIECKALDDVEVISVLTQLENNPQLELFDDGNHNDGDSADNVFANVYSFEYFPSSATEVMNVNNITLPFDNTGIFENVDVAYFQNSIFTATDNDGDGIDYTKELEINYPSFASYDEGAFLFSGGFQLSGYTNGNLWANGQMSVSLILNFVPGRVGDQPDDPRNVVYTLRADDTPFGVSWQRWKDAVNLGADFYDGDNDGLYKPVDKNWNGIWDFDEDMPDILGDQTSWCVYNDGKPGNQRVRFSGVDPQGIEVHQTLFASAKPELEDIIFIRYKITNKGTVANVLDSVIFSFFRDPDIGYDFDLDLVGCDTVLNSSLCYKNSDDSFYGQNPPAFFTTLLQGPIARSQGLTDTAYNHRGKLLGIKYFPGYVNENINAFVKFNIFPWGGPGDKFEARNYSKGLLPQGIILDPCANYQGEVLGGINCNEVNPKFWFSGDPVENIGWINNAPTDQRDLLSVGEFTLEKDKPVTIIAAYVLGRGSDAINSITVARQNVQRAIEEYNNNFISLAYNPGEPVYPVTDYKLYQNYPNPFNPITTIRYEIPVDGIVTIKIYDILGQEVRTILNEFKKADRYEIQFNSGGLASGVYICRMRVNDQFKSKKMIVLK